MRAGPRLRALIVEDVEDDALLVTRELRRGGWDVEFHRVDTAEAMRDALGEGPWDLVICDWNMPTFDPSGALGVLEERGLDIPFLVVSGAVGEEYAVAAMKSGAHDYFIKGRLGRLVPAVERELRESEGRMQRRRSEEALRASELRFRSLVSSMDDVVFTLDRQQRYDGFYGGSGEWRGGGMDRFLGKRAADILGADQAPVHDAANARALGGESLVYEWTLAAPGEAPQYFHTSLAPLRAVDGEVTGVVGVSRDISEKKRVEAQLLMGDRMASVGLLAAGLAHEINNPLAAIVSNVEFIRSRLHGAAGAEVESALADCSEGLERVRNIVRDLKLFSRAEEESAAELVDVRRVLDSTARMATNEIRHRARLTKDYQEVPAIAASEARLGQVFLNLVMNAAQAIPEGHAEQNEIALRVRFAAGRVVVEVRDSGSGMDAETMKRLFTPFFTTKGIGEGTGLGLAICHRLVSAAGGTIEVESLPGRGTTFRVSFAAAPEPAAPAVPARPSVVLPAVRRGRILVVDDEPMIGSALRRALASDHDVEAVTRAAEALARLAAGERYDVIFSDVMMPEMTGMELHAHLQRSYPEHAARTIFLTGGAFTEETRRYLAETPNECVDKPFDLGHLRRLIGARLRPMDGEGVRLPA